MAISPLAAMGLAQEPFGVITLHRLPVGRQTAPNRRKDVLTGEADEDGAGDMIRQTFSLLSHTPIVACGINPHVHYLVGNEAYWHKIGHTLAPKELVWNGLLERPGMQSLTIKAPRRGDVSGEINATVEPSVKHRPGV